MVTPHGGKLINCFSNQLPSCDHKVTVDHNTLIDIHNIATGAYSPLIGFATQDDFESILESMKLSSGELWSIPIILDVSGPINEGQVQIHDESGTHVATLIDVQTYPFDKERYCQKVFGTIDSEHPGVKKVLEKSDYLLGGQIIVKQDWGLEFEGIDSLQMMTPLQTREHFEVRGHTRVVAFQTRNVPHRGHEYIQKCALEMVDGLLVHPVIGEKKVGDFRDDIILGSYQVLLKKYYNPQRVTVSCLPWVMRYAGPKEAIMHAIIRQNFGCTHFIIGRDHAGVGSYYGTYEAQEIFDTIKPGSLAIEIMRFENAAYCPEVHGVVTDKTAPSPEAERIFISGTKFRTMLQDGQDAPKEFIRPEIMEYLHSQKDLFVQ